jgi:hypothetical protein
VSVSAGQGWGGGDKIAGSCLLQYRKKLTSWVDFLATLIKNLQNIL